MNYEEMIRSDQLEHETKQKICSLDDIVNALRMGKLSVFAGAGLSAASGYVDWKNLLKPMCDQLGLNINMDLTLIAQYYENEYTRHKLNQAIINEFSKVPKKNDNMEILASLPIRNYWTTNYDSLIEDVLKQNGKTVDIISEQIQYKNYTPGRDAVVYKMHGDKKIPDRAVLTRDDYEVYDAKRAVFTNGLLMELITSTFLFIGIGFSDPNLDRIISLVKHIFENYTPPTHYCFMRSVDYHDYLDEKGKFTEQKRTEYGQDKRLQNLKIKSMARYGIQTILVDDFKQITAMLEYIRKKYTLNKVFISGGLNPEDPTNYGEDFNGEEEPKSNSEENSKAGNRLKKGENLIMQLSKRLIDDGYDIVNGFGVGIGNYVVSGAYMGGSKMGGADYVTKHLYIHPLISIGDKEIRKQIREKLISECGTVIFMFGKTIKNSKDKDLEEDGTYSEYLIADEKGKNIIPIRETGWTAERIYCNKFGGDDKKEKEINTTELVNKVMERIVKTTRDKEAELKKILTNDVFIKENNIEVSIKENNIKVFISFCYKDASKQAQFIHDELENEEGILPVKEFEKRSENEIGKWIDEKICNSSVTIILLSKNISTSKWVDYEINRSIQQNNKFVFIDISNNTFDKSFLEKFKINNKSIDQIFEIHTIKDIDSEQSFSEVGKWVKEVAKKTE